MTEAAKPTALLSCPVLPAWFGPDDIVRFLVVSIGVFLPGCAKPSVILHFVFGLTVLVAAWTRSLEWYEVPPWWDLAIHVLTTGAFVGTGYFASCRMVIVAHIPDTKSPCSPRSILLPLALGRSGGGVAGIAGMVRPQLSPRGHTDRLPSLRPGSRNNRIPSCRWADDPLVMQARKAGRAGIPQQDVVILWHQ